MLTLAMFSDAVRMLLFPATMALAASCDLLTMRISNRIPAILAAGFFVLAARDAMPLCDLGDHLTAGLTVLVFAFLLFARGWVGGGDAKLAAATALWLGWVPLGDYVVDLGLLGGTLTVLLLAFRCRVLPPILADQDWALRLHAPDGGVPYGIALAGAALLVYPSTAWMMAPGL